ncbi:hypothetical protein M1349_04415 [Patescibacteria group bacterium]|nr:hypothetical protein [Patescibacteria group bacterium]
MALKVVQTIALPEKTSGKRIIDITKRLAGSCNHRYIQELELVVDNTAFYRVGVTGGSLGILILLILTGGDHDDLISPSLKYGEVAVVCEAEANTLLGITKEGIIAATINFKKQLEDALKETGFKPKK